VRKSVFEEVGGLNESDLPVAFNDIDFCLRLKRKGYRNIYAPSAKLYHHESATRGRAETPEQQAQYMSEIAYMKSNWADMLANDPAYSPNLTLAHADFSLAWPPRIISLPEDCIDPV